jgi:hypothetical protein
LVLLRLLGLWDLWGLLLILGICLLDILRSILLLDWWHIVCIALILFVVLLVVSHCYKEMFETYGLVDAPEEQLGVPEFSG